MKFEILDCTLRDGSYVNKFQFSAMKHIDFLIGIIESASFYKSEVNIGNMQSSQLKRVFILTRKKFKYINLALIKVAQVNLN
jgi:isopropylmalate/homocitrate/citramalate synthase